MRTDNQGLTKSQRLKDKISKLDLKLNARKMKFKTARTMFIAPFSGDNTLDFGKLKEAIKNNYGKTLNLEEIKVHWNKPVAYSRCAEQYVQLTENSEAILRHCKFIH